MSEFVFKAYSGLADDMQKKKDRFYGNMRWTAVEMN